MRMRMRMLTASVRRSGWWLFPQGFDASYHYVENVRFGCIDPGAVNFNGSTNFNSVRRLGAWTRVVLGRS
jgi:hypothetical protein